MALVRWDPFRSLRPREDVFDDLFRELLHRPEGAGVIEPPAEVSEVDGEVIVRMAVPGVEYGAFQRTVPLPAEVEGEKATAALKNGMLTITLPKSRQPKAHEVKVAVL